jgi:quinol monooxygenase YgiN
MDSTLTILPRMTPQVMIARLYALEGQEETGRSLLREAQASTHNEAGCRLYALHVDEADPRSFVMIEIWDDDAAFESHIASPHIQALIGKSAGVFAGPPELQLLNALPFGHPVKGAVKGD